MEPTRLVGLQVVMIVHQMWVVQVGDQVLGALDVVQLLPVEHDPLDPALAGGERRPGAGAPPQYPGVVAELHFRPGRLVHHRPALK